MRSYKMPLRNLFMYFIYKLIIFKTFITIRKVYVKLMQHYSIVIHICMYTLYAKYKH